MIARLICLVRGHRARRLNGTFYVVCDRGDATLNLRVKTAGSRPIGPHCIAGIHGTRERCTAWR